MPRRDDPYVPAIEGSLTAFLLRIESVETWMHHQGWMLARSKAILYVMGTERLDLAEYPQVSRLYGEWQG